MKKLVTILLLMICSFVIYSQSAQEEHLLNGIAFTDKDSLLPRHFFTQAQTLQIYSFNIQAGPEERELRKKYSSPDSLKFHLNKVELKRDSLYKKLLPQDKYQLYKQKKVLLISHDRTFVFKQD